LQFTPAFLQMPIPRPAVATLAFPVTTIGCRRSCAKAAGVSYPVAMLVYLRYPKTTKQMDEIGDQLRALFNRIPRRHTADNVKEMYNILDAYEDVLKEMESDSRYEQRVAPLFEALDPIRAAVKKSNDPKASKKGKDVLFDEASGALKDTMEEAMKL
jgi:hypothetical protein